MSLKSLWCLAGVSVESSGSSAATYIGDEPRGDLQITGNASSTIAPISSTVAGSSDGGQGRERGRRDRRGRGRGGGRSRGGTGHGRGNNANVAMAD